MHPWRLSEITYKTVKDTRYEVAVLPIGATEPHNLHLPYGTDALSVEAVADRACARAHQEGARVVLLPAIPYGVDANMMAFPLAMHVSMKTLSAFVEEIVRTLERHGIRKLILVNGHGGNEFKGFLRDMYGTTKVFLTLVNWWQVPSDIRETLFVHGGDHADEMETSTMLYLYPDLVHLEQADPGAVRQTRFEAINRGWAGITRPWHLLTTHSGAGDPRQASREKGERWVNTAVERLAGFIKALSDAEMDEAFPYEQDG
jgi:creatinine amidohydrolase